MIFQLDQCFDDDDFVQACEAGGKAKLWHFPKKMRGMKDDEILPHFMARFHPFLTSDYRIAEAHTKHIPDQNPGIVMVCYSKENLRSATSMGLQKIIRQFKGICPGWNQLTYANSVLQLTEKEIFIWHVKDGKLHRDEYLPFSDNMWHEKFREVLRRNASRKQLN